MKPHSITLLIVILMASLTALSQRSGLRIATGMASVRGEFSSNNPMADQWGMNYSLKFIKPFANERWSFTVTSGFGHQTFSRDFGQPKVFYKTYQASTEFQSIARQTYLGAGLRYYLTNSVNKYNPFRGQLLPYIGLSLGGVYNNITLVGAENLPEGYTSHEGSAYSLSGQVEGGIGYVLDDHWVVEVFGALRPAFTDGWDGIAGTTDNNDWFVQLGAGIYYRL